jgi:hypothetical protein
VPSKRALLGWLLALTVALVVGTAGTALACGPSAGDCQYTDPLSTSTSTTAHPTTAPPATTPSTPVQSTVPTATTADPATATTTASSKSSKTLPYTGYAAWVGGALGVFLIAGGIAVRRRYVTR